MAIIKCRECKQEVSSSAKKCPHCGVSTPEKADYYTGLLLKSLLGAFILYLIFSGRAEKSLNKHFPGLFNSLKNNSCEVFDSEAKHEMLMVNNQPDYGISIYTSVRNIGASRKIKIVAKLSTSEGEFTREQNVMFKQNQVRRLSYGFQEPTVNVKNVQYQISCDL